MKDDWILDVLADLKSFASANHLVALADQLDDTRLIAAAEIASRGSKVRVSAHGDEIPAQRAARKSGRQHFA